MKKMPTLFVRDPADRGRVLPEVYGGCEWVLAGEGVATRKWDGTCVMLDEHGEWWARREVKQGKGAPPNFVPLQMDAVTKKVMGWEPVAQSAHARWHAEALANSPTTKPGTYELLGPKVNGNRDDFAEHILIAHGWAPLSDRIKLESAPRDFDGLHAWLHAHPYEGIVWWRNPEDPDCDKVKLKARDFPRTETPNGPEVHIRMVGNGDTPLRYSTLDGRSTEQALIDAGLYAARNGHLRPRFESLENS